jgi:hypothetical protein
MNDWTYWRAVLSDEKPAIHPDHPQPGYYRARLRKDEPFMPVAIYQCPTRNTIYCKVGYDRLFVLHSNDTDGGLNTICDIWTYCCDKAIEYGHYLDWTISHRQPHDDSRAAEILDHAKQTIDASEDEGELESLFNRLEAVRRNENADVLAAKKLNDEKFNKLKEACKEKMKQLRKERQNGP